MATATKGKVHRIVNYVHTSVNPTLYTYATACGLWVSSRPDDWPTEEVFGPVPVNPMPMKWRDGVTCKRCLNLPGTTNPNAL